MNEPRTNESGNLEEIRRLRDLLALAQPYVAYRDAGSDDERAVAAATIDAGIRGEWGA